MVANTQQQPLTPPYCVFHSQLPTWTCFFSVLSYMATKYHTLPEDGTGASALAHFPPEISLESQLLGSVIDLPEHASITYKVYTLDSTAPGTSSDPFCIIEQARKKLIRDFKSSPIVNSLIPSVRVGRDYAELYVFAVGSTQVSTDSVVRLVALRLDSLIGVYSLSKVSFILWKI